MLMISRLLLRKIPSLENNIKVHVFGLGRSVERFIPVSCYSTQESLNEFRNVDNGTGKGELAKNLSNLIQESLIYSTQEEGHGVEKSGKSFLAQNLASLVEESYDVPDRKMKPRTRLEVKRYLEKRVKKKVKGQYRNGKFQDLLVKVIADPTTLKDAYDWIRVSSNVDLASEDDSLPFETIAEELTAGNFDIGANTYSISTRGPKPKEELVFPKLNLRVVQEAIRMVLEIIYKPHFSKISHGFRSGRGHCSALRYIRQEISNPDWWFTLRLNRKLDDCILSNLLSSFEDKIEDPGLCVVLRQMFDAKVVNMEFGGFPKGHGLPQEGVLSPILMNIYLDLLDREVYRLSMQYEISDHQNAEENKSNSKLRGWFRRQITTNNLQQVGTSSDVRIHCVRFMDEILFAISGPKEVSLSLKSDIERYLKNFLCLEVDNQSEVLACRDAPGIKFLGTLIKSRPKKDAAVIAIHKLQGKVKMFAEQKQELWDSGTVRIGKKWLAHGLKKVKESEIKHLVDSSSILHQVSRYRKPGMKTDHWYKELLKVWMQDVNAKGAECEEMVLAKHLIEVALPQELTDSFNEFQKRAKDYVLRETASMLALLPVTCAPEKPVSITEVLVPVEVIMKRLHRYGLTYREGYARVCHILVLLDDTQIIDWYAGIVKRWLRWYKQCDNFGQVKQIISNQVRMSCIRTLASKHRIHEVDIEKKFDSELCRIPSTQEIELKEAGDQVLSQESEFDGAMTYGLNSSGLCLLSLARKVSQSRPCYCFVLGCSTRASYVYAIHVMERQKFPAWITGFSCSIHPSLNRRRLGLCKQHLRDLFLGDISLQSIEFGAWR